jgi:hypothetical protein
MDDAKQHIVGLGLRPFNMEEYLESERRFWSCPTTGRDCRSEPRPVIGLDMRTGRCRVYASADVAPTLRVIRLVRGMSADYLLDNWQHYAMKTWVDHASLNEMMRRVAWEFGSQSWASCMTFDDPTRRGRPRRQPEPDRPRRRSAKRGGQC